jgi:hypothetical protein
MVAAAVGLVGILAPLTVVWLVLFGDVDAWGALWPASVRIWQLGHLVPVHIDVTAFAQDLGIADAGASFWLGLPPLLFGAFTLLFAVRSGRRAVSAGKPWIAIGAATIVMAGVAVAAQLTSTTPVATVSTWQGIAFPVLVYVVGMLGGIAHDAWNDGDDGPIDSVHDYVDGWGPAWRELPALVLRGSGVVVVGLVGAAGLLFAVLVAFNGDDIIALYEAAQADVVGATVITLGQLAFVPTLLVWMGGWIAGPGFAIGTSTAVSPAGTSLGVVPGIPILGILPEGSSAWMLLSALVPVALGALGGWIVRRTYARDWAFDGEGPEPAAPRAAIAAGIAICSGIAWAVLASAASGSLGPGRLADVGADPLAVGITVGLETLVGAGILLLAPLPKPVTEDDWDSLTDDD